MRHKKMSRVLVVVLLVGVVFAVSQARPMAQGAGAAQMPPGVQQMKAANGTTVLANAKGMTLYTFAKDMPGVSNCNDKCAVAWPPLAAPADAKAMGNFTVITRADGTKQWAYKGMALYTWMKDVKPGDTSGDGVGGAWKAATP